MFEKKGTCSTFYCSIHMAGDVTFAKHFIAKYTMKGACVQVYEADYIYTGGQHKGFVARLINYPRFPSSRDAILAEATELAHTLAGELSQMSFTIETPEQSFYYERDGKGKEMLLG